ncbi:unnamed protein product, partial [Ectocarpus sp. 8 AP-2014]
DRQRGRRDRAGQRGNGVPIPPRHSGAAAWRGDHAGGAGRSRGRQGERRRDLRLQRCHPCDDESRCRLGAFRAPVVVTANASCCLVYLGQFLLVKGKSRS